MYKNLQEKLKKNWFLNFKNMQKTLERLAILILIQQLGKKHTGLCNCLEIRS